MSSHQHRYNVGCAELRALAQRLLDDCAPETGAEGEEEAQADENPGLLQ